MPKYFEIKAQSEEKAELWLTGFVGNSVFDDINPVDLIEQVKDLGNVKQIDVYINSEGGSVTAGNVIYNYLKQHEAKIVTRVDGIAASMASVIAMAGDEVVMANNAMMMIHDPWTSAAGNSKEFRKIADVLDKAKETIISSYVSKTGLSEHDVSDLMSDETWMTAKEAVDFGFADSLSDDVDIAACVKNINIDNFSNLPTQLNLKLKLKEKTMSKENVVTQTKDDKQAIEAAAVEKALKAEDSRRSDISAMFKPFAEQFGELEKMCLNDRSVDKVKAQELLLNKMGERSEPIGHDVRVVEDRSIKMQEGFTSALMARVGLGKDNARNEFRGYTLSEMARYCLEGRGVATKNMDRMEMVGAAFTHSTGDFPELLRNVASKTMLKGWEEAPETYQEWTNKGVLTDFKPTYRVDMNSFPSLREVDQSAEYKYATVGERGEMTQLATYGELFSINRQTIINDDLQAFSKLPLKMGRAARRTIGNLVYAVLTSNAAMADGDALFHANHSNIGTTGGIATATVDELRKLLALQTDGTAQALGIAPAFLLVPEALRGAAIVAVESETEIAANQNNSKRKNSVRNIAQVISDSRLDADSATRYYMTASPVMHDTIEVSYLDGVEQPFLEQQDGWKVDGTEFKVRIDAGVKALDHRTMAKNDGA